MDEDRKNSLESQKDGTIITDLHYLEAVSSIEQIKQYKKQSFQKMNIKPGNIILDLGCGNGDEVIEISKLTGTEGKVIGIDVNEQAIKVALTKVPSGTTNVEFVHQNGEKIPFKDNFFDSVRADRVFQHLIHPAIVLREMIRVTKPNGLITIIDPDWDSLTIDSNDMRIARKIIKNVSDQHENPCMGRELYRLMKENNLDVIDIKTVTLITTKFVEMDYGVGFTPVYQRELEKENFTKIKLDSWLKNLYEKDKIGHFFSTLTLFMLTGKKTSLM